ncbi:hypothetical protein BH11CYA1_BH11CYA1_10130 [soil metagenome]
MKNVMIASPCTVDWNTMEGNNQDQDLLTQLGKVAEKAEGKRSSRQVFIILFIVLALAGLLGGPLSTITSLALLVLVLPQILRAPAPENAEPTRLSYSRESTDSCSDSVAARFEQISTACQNLAREDAFFLRQPFAQARIRQANEIQVNDLESKPWCIGNQKDMLYFLPEYIVRREGVDHALISYSLLLVTLQAHAQVRYATNPVLITFIAPQGPFFELLVAN